jgi:hypothetical protein
MLLDSGTNDFAREAAIQISDKIDITTKIYELILTIFFTQNETK